MLRLLLSLRAAFSGFKPVVGSKSCPEVAGSVSLLPMTRTLSATLSALAVIGTTLAVAAPAQAANTVDKGTLRIAAERLVSVGVTINADADFYIGTLPAISPIYPALQFARAGVDYFIIDGLSLGGSAGFSFTTAGSSVAYGFMPRVGYAFDLTDKIEFWPRGGIGFAGFDGDAGSTSSAVIQIEGMFSLELVPHALFQFGPTLDAALADGWPVDVGAVAGFAIEL